MKKRWLLTLLNFLCFCSVAWGKTSFHEGLSRKFYFRSQTGYEVIEDLSSLESLDPSMSSRETLKIRLENGLEVYLVSDPKSVQSGAALCVEAGSWNDPKGHPGMAHFIEHLLFMGTEAYPDEAEYWRFIHDHGGQINAYTMHDRTIFGFSIDDHVFEKGLDRFSHFFIDPLLSSSSISREIHAVDHEFGDSLENNFLRAWRIFKETGDSSHPNALLSIGNLTSLSRVTHEEAEKWYRAQYLPQKMHLMLYSKFPLNAQLSFVLNTFSKIPASSDLQVEEISRKKMSSQMQRGHFIYMQPRGKEKSLLLAWEIPSEFVIDDQTKAPEVLAWILNYLQERGLLGLLQKEELAENLEANVYSLDKNHLLFITYVQLTEKGVLEREKVIELCFRTFATLKKEGVPSHVAEALTRFVQKYLKEVFSQKTFEIVMHHATLMMDEELRTFPKNSYTIPYDSDSLTKFLNTLTPESGIFFVMAPSSLTDVFPNTKEKWMKTEYVLREIPQEWLKKWQEAEPHPKIQYPSKEELEVSLSSDQEEDAEVDSLTIEDEMGEVEFFPLPSGTADFLAILDLQTPSLDGSLKSRALSAIYVEMLQRYLQKKSLFAEKLNYFIWEDELELSIGIVGEHEKPREIFTELFRTLKNPFWDVQLFDECKKSLINAYEMDLSPLLDAQMIMESILLTHAFTIQEVRDAMEQVSLEDFAGFAKDLFNQVRIEGAIEGNLNEEEMHAFWSDFKTIVCRTPYSLDEVERRVFESLELSDQLTPFKVKESTSRFGHALVLVIDEGEDTLENLVCQKLISHVLKQAFFDELRTKQQTAYSIASWSKSRQGRLYQYFIIQSTTHSAEDLLMRLEIFLNQFLINYESILPPDRFETIRHTFSIHHAPNDESDEEEEEEDDDLKTSENEQFRLCLEGISYQKVKQGAFDFLSTNNVKRLAVLVEGILSPFAQESTIEKTDLYKQITKEELRQLLHAYKTK